MEHHSQTDDTLQSRAVLEAQLRECFGRVVYSHKTHEKCSDILLAQWRQIKLWQLILAALSAGGFIAAVFGAGRVGAILGVVISTALLALNAYTKNYDHGELAQKHKQAAGNLWLVRERYFSLLTDLAMGERPIESLQSERDTILTKLHSIYSAAPPTNSKAYLMAQEALQMKQDLTFSAAEIDAFLPKELKRGPKSS